MDAIEHGDVRLARGLRLGFVVDALAKQIERRSDAARVEPGNGSERGVECFSSDEPVGKALRQPVVANEFEYLLLTGEIKKGAAKHQFSSGAVMVVEVRRMAPRPRRRSKILVTGNRPPFLRLLSKRFQVTKPSSLSGSSR